VLRALVLALLLANLGFWVWSQGWLDDITGFRAGDDREPERLARQVRPESIVILAPGAAARGNAGASSAAAPASAPGAALACLEAGPFVGAESVAAAAAVLAASLPPGSWADVKTERPGSWIVYLGKFADRAALAKRVDDLKRLNIDATEVRSSPALEPGLVLGRFDDRGKAEKALEQLAQRGVRTAKLVEISAPGTAHLLRVDPADAVLVTQVMALKNEALGKGFGLCAKPAGN
jgi:hypothetical protein